MTGAMTAIIAGNQENSDAASVANAFEARVEIDGGVFEAESCLVSQIQRLKSLGFWGQLSWVLTPNGYRESKIYAAVPTSGAGDMAFVRAGTKTRKGPTYVENVPYNLLSRSETFDNAYWTKQSCTVTPNALNNHLGNLTADSMFEVAALTTHYLNSVSISKSSIAAQYRLSYYVKANGRDWIHLQSYADGQAASGKYFNVTTGIVGATISGAFTLNDSSIEAKGNGWYLCSIVFTTDTGATIIGLVGSASEDGVSSFLGDVTKGLHTFGGQLVLLSTVRDYQLTTDRFNVPGLDYTGSTCPALLLEPQRTNLLLQSETFDNVSWVKTEVTPTANAITSPDNINTGDQILETIVNSNHSVTQSISKAASSLSYSYSISVKPIGRDWFWLSLSEGPNAVRKWYNLTTQTLGSTTIVGAGFTFTSATIEAAINGYYRITLIATSSAGTVIVPGCSSATGDTVVSFVGDVTKGFSPWGAQLEQAAYASSYIPTTTASVTRIADSVTALTGVSSLIGQTEGTLYFEGSSFADSTNKGMSISDGTSNNRITLFFLSTNLINVEVRTAGASQANISNAGFVTGTTYRIAITYQSNKVAFFINGVKIGEDLTVVVPACSVIENTQGGAGAIFYGFTKMRLFYPTALTDTQAIALTT